MNRDQDIVLENKATVWNGTEEMFLSNWNGEGMPSLESLSRNVPTGDIAITNLDFGHMAFVAYPSRALETAVYFLGTCSTASRIVW